MFIVLLKFSREKARAGELMAAHREWLKRGFADGVFLLAGSLELEMGGALMAHNLTRPELQARVERDPFVAENIVSAEILEITPSKTAESLTFLLQE